MGKIHLLDRHTAELIAAGEVVERPASAAKELIENSIDAGASQITVEITGGGVRCLRVTDNGCGIAREDVEKAFLRHATSKITTAEDLDGIVTLGFRGEALASISAVSKIELITRTENELAGTHYMANGGEDAVVEDIGCSQGTTILVKDLFYNIPARMKFLKKDVSEANAVAGVVERVALSHPEIAFRFIREGKQELLTPGDGSIDSAVYAVCGRDFAKETLRVDYSYGGVSVTGVISKPVAARANRVMQYFFINGRFVKSKTAMAALEQGFKGCLMTGRFPACVLYLTMPAEVVDVNVHPAKIEVRFLSEKPVFDAVYYGVRSALTNQDTPKQVTVPSASSSNLSQESLKQQLQTPVFRAEQPALAEKPKNFTEKADTTILHLKNNTTPQQIYQNSSSINIDIFPDELPTDTVQETVLTVPKSEVKVQPKQQVIPEIEKQPFHLIGQLFDTYVLVQQENNFLLIDKHAAHERIIYEKLRATANQSQAQMLLQSVSISLGREEYAALIENVTLLQQAGFEIEDFGAGSLLVRGVPMILTGEDVSAVLQEIAGRFIDGKRDVTTEKLDWIYHSVACRAAVKAGDRSHMTELQALAEQVLNDPQLRYCPHGRPVCIQMTRHEIEKMFGRIV